MSVNLSPIGNGFQFFTTTGLPLNGGLINTYAAGTTTSQATFNSSTGLVQNANPIVLGTDGRPQSGGQIIEIWLTGGVSYKFQLTDSLNNIIATYDNLTGINDIGSTASSTDYILMSGITLTFVSATSFTISGNQTTIFTANLRIRTVNTGGTIYSAVVSSSYSAGPNTTTVTVVNDSGVLDAGLSSVSYSILNSQHPAMPPYQDVEYVIQNTADPTKLVKFDASNLQTNQIASVKIPGNVTPANAIMPLTFTVSGNTIVISLAAGTGMVFNDGSIATVSPAVSLTVPASASLGTVSNVASKLWVVGMKNGGSPELAVRNNVSGVNIAGIDLSSTITTSQVVAGSNSALVWYSATARTAQPFCVLGSGESSQAAAGTWASAFIRQQGFGPGVSLPLTVIQALKTPVTTSASGTTVMAINDTVPTSTQGDLYMSQIITPSSQANMLEVEAQALHGGGAANTTIAAAMFQDSVTSALVAIAKESVNNGLMTENHRLLYTGVCGTTQATTFKYRAGSSGGSSVGLNAAGGARVYNGVANTFIAAREIVT